MRTAHRVAEVLTLWLCRAGKAMFEAVISASRMWLCHRALRVAAPSSAVAMRVAWRGWHARMWIGSKSACSHSPKRSLPLLIQIGYDDVDRLFTCG